MKIRLHSLILITLGVILFAGKSFAAGVGITGTAYNDEMGVIHFDYTTAENPDSSDPTYDASGFYVGPTKQFYIDPYTYSNDYNGPGDPLKTAMVSTEDADCGPTGCLLRGFIWSDTIGWISLDGEIINTSLNTPPGDENTINDPYPSYMWPMAKVVPANPSNNKYGLTGYIWNEYTGWIRLSSDTAGVTGITTDVGSQALGDWGVYLDADDSIAQTQDQDNITVDKGRPLHGYAWSENLGWIKFTKEAGDSFAFDFGVFTTWLPDDTPAIPLTPAIVWFAVGKNTGYVAPAEPTTIIWDDFAADPQSGINTNNTKIHFELADPVAFANCNKPADSTIETLLQTKPLPPSYPVSGTGNTLTLTLPVLGNIKTPPMAYGYCRYEVHAKIVNGNNDAIYMGDPTYFGDPAAPIDNIKYFDKPTVFVRAGDVDVASSTANWDTDGTAYADGEDFVKYDINLADVAGNPIMDVDCIDPGSPPNLIYAGCPTRDVNLTAGTVNDMVFDLTQPKPSLPYLAPIKHSDVNVGGSIDYLLADVTDPDFIGGAGNNEWAIPVERTLYTYSLELASYAPGNSSSGDTYDASTDTYETKDFHINSFDGEVIDDALPATSQWITSLSPLTLADKPGTETIAQTNTDDIGVGSTVCGTNTYSCPVFTPPITTDIPTSGNPLLVSGGLQNVLSVGLPTQVEFSINNLSTKKISPTVSGSDEGGVSIDNIFQYYSSTFGGSLAAIMETHKIENITGGAGSDTDYAWTNPFETCTDCTRYEMYMKYGDYNPSGNPPYNGKFSASNSPFHTFFLDSSQPDHGSGNKFLYDFGLTYDSAYSNIINKTGLPDITAEIGNDGKYYITGREDIPFENQPIDPEADLADPYNYPATGIDRSDETSFVLASSVDKKIQFVPQKFVSSTINDIDFRLAQEIAYRFSGQPLPTVYGIAPILEDIEVKDIGLEAIGTVATEKIVTGRQFETVGTAGARKLQEQIRRNVAQLTAGLTTANCKLASGATEIISTFPSSGPCVITDSVNNTRFIYYEGDTSNEIVLDNTAGDSIVLPILPYTLIVKGGANIYIKDNLYYPTGAGITPSFGIINIAETVGKGANTYISPDPTNIAAVLYTEGSLLSRSNTGDLYYGGASGNAQDLSNQLYWQGSIASRNTIAGAGQEKIPTGVECETQDTKQACAQRFDLDYLRRFTISTDTTAGTTFIANGGKFSGGGTCNASGICSLGAGPLPTVIKLSGGATGYILDEPLSQNAPVFVKKDPGTLNNPPPGFTVTEGLETTQEIR